MARRQDQSAAYARHSQARTDLLDASVPARRKARSSFLAPALIALGPGLAQDLAPQILEPSTP